MMFVSEVMMAFAVTFSRTNDVILSLKEVILYLLSSVRYVGCRLFLLCEKLDILLRQIHVLS